MGAKQLSLEGDIKIWNLQLNPLQTRRSSPFHIPIISFISKIEYFVNHRNEFGLPEKEKVLAIPTMIDVASAEPISKGGWSGQINSITL